MGHELLEALEAEALDVQGPGHGGGQPRDILEPPVAHPQIECHVAEGAGQLSQLVAVHGPERRSGRGQGDRSLEVPLCKPARGPDQCERGVAHAPDRHPADGSEKREEPEAEEDQRARHSTHGLADGGPGQRGLFGLEGCVIPHRSQGFFPGFRESGLQRMDFLARAGRENMVDELLPRRAVAFHELGHRSKDSVSVGFLGNGRKPLESGTELLRGALEGLKLGRTGNHGEGSGR